MLLIVKTGCAHSLQPKNNPCTIRKNDVCPRPASNRQHARSLRIYHRLRTHTRLRRRKGRGRQRRTNPHRTSQTPLPHFPTIPRDAPTALHHSSRTSKSRPTATTPGLRNRSRPHHHNWKAPNSRRVTHYHGCNNYCIHEIKEGPTISVW